MSHGNMHNALEDWRAHMRVAHNDEDYGRRVLERHDDRYPNCIASRPSLKDYVFGGQPRRSSGSQRIP